MLTRRGFLHKASLVAGAALMGLGLRKVPKAQAEGMATVVGRGPIVPRLEHLGMTVDPSKASGPYNGMIDLHTDTGPGEWPDIWPMREPTEQEIEKWRADLQAMCDKIEPWMEAAIEEAAETARQVADLFEPLMSHV